MCRHCSYMTPSGVLFFVLPHCMFITIINDCADQNAAGRQGTRVAALFGVAPTMVGVRGTLDAAAELEASGNIVDALDAAGSARGAILVNVAPRSDDEKRWGNGTPFCYLWVGSVLVVATVSGYTLSLLKRLGLLREVQVLDLAGTVGRMCERSDVDPNERARIIGSQFRSLDFVPRVAHFLLEGGEPVAEPLDPTHVPDAPLVVWMVDSFGNAKTTLLGGAFAHEATIATAWGVLPVVHALKDVQNGTAAITIGSSGYGTDRFLEIVVMGGSAERVLGIRHGAKVFA